MSDERKGPPKIDVEEILSGEPSEEMPEITEVVVIEDEDTVPPAQAPEELDVPETDPEPPPAAAASPGPAAPVAEDELEARHLRLRADFDNFRRRVAREQEELRTRASEDLVRELLPVLDNLDRALEGPVGDGETVFRDGIELIHRQLREVLEAAGLEPVVAVGEPFDPELHEAVSSRPVEGTPENTVAEEVQRGYRFKGKLLRPSMVVVSQAPSVAQAAPQETVGDDPEAAGA